MRRDKPSSKQSEPATLHGRQVAYDREMCIRDSCKSDYRPVAMALDGSNALGLHAAKHKAVFGDDRRLLEQERIGRAIADCPGDRLNLRENFGLFP